MFWIGENTEQILPPLTTSPLQYKVSLGQRQVFAQILVQLLLGHVIRMVVDPCYLVHRNNMFTTLRPLPLVFLPGPLSVSGWFVSVCAIRRTKEFNFIIFEWHSLDRILGNAPKHPLPKHSIQFGKLAERTQLDMPFRRLLPWSRFPIDAKSRGIQQTEIRLLFRFITSSSVANWDSKRELLN